MVQMVVQRVAELFTMIHNRHPLIHQITNNVTINDCANVTLAIGASPVMATSVEEVADMVNLANALVINFGTVDDHMYKAMVRAGEAANERGIPVIFDPVGVGATRFRTEKARELLRHVNIAIVRGNASEVYALCGGTATTRGVDAGTVRLPVNEIAMKAAQQFRCITVVSGEQDVVADERSFVKVVNGDQRLTKVTGTGCMATALIGCFAGVTDDYFAAAIGGISVMGLAGERAGKQLDEHEGIGSFKVKLMDHIFHMDADTWEQEVRLSEG